MSDSVLSEAGRLSRVLWLPALITQPCHCMQHAECATCCDLLISSIPQRPIGNMGLDWEAVQDVQQRVGDAFKNYGMVSLSRCHDVCTALLGLAGCPFLAADCDIFAAFPPLHLHSRHHR